jgi:hypothetical protein
MKKILTTSAVAAVAIGLAASVPANAQEFFANAYTRPAEMVDGIQVGTRVGGADLFAPARVVVAQHCHAGTACGRRMGAH